MLDAINALRSRGHGPWPAVAPLVPHPDLHRAASMHAEHLAATERLDHVDEAGRDGPMRVTQTGYRWSFAGETLARGQPDADATLISWRDSPGHCEVLLNPNYVHVGAALGRPPLAMPAFPTYWVAVFAAPLER